MSAANPFTQIPGVVFTSTTPTEAPYLLVIGREKCLRGSTEILDPRTGRLVTIAEIVSSVKGDSAALTMGPAGLLERTTPINFFQHPPEQLYKLRTQSGREIEATATHPFMTQRGWVALRDLDHDHDRVMVVAEYPTDVFWRGSAKDSDDWTKILAYLIADGSLGASSPVFTKMEQAVREDFIDAVTAVGDDITLFENGGVEHVRVKARPGKENRTKAFIREQGLDGALSADKIIPPHVFGMSKSKMALFLNRLFTCDGSAEVAGKVSYSSRSMRLVRQVQHLLARFGIVSVIRDRFLDDQLYGAELIVSSRANVIRFADEIGMYGAKGQRLRELRADLAASSTVADETQLWRHGPYLLDRIRSVEPTAIESTYDIEIAATHNFVANDFVVHNSGKSTLATTLFGWPKPESQPLVIAADPTGPDSCAKMGFRVAHLKIRDMPGARYTEKIRSTVDAIERGLQAGARPGSLVLDCMSVMVERIMSDDERYSKNPDPRSHYNVALDVVRNTLNRLIDFGIPLVVLAWLEEGVVVESTNAAGQKQRRMVLGGASIMGRKARALVAGKSTMILVLDKVKQGVGTPGADQDGYVRQLRTRTWENIEAGGRYTLPDPAPPHLGWVLSTLMAGPQGGGQIPSPNQIQSGSPIPAQNS